MSEQPKRQTARPDPPYIAFLVRCWREDGQWRIVLENVATRERSGFEGLKKLFEALQTTLEQTNPSDTQ